MLRNNYEIQMLADVINYDLHNVECQRLLPVMEETFYRSGCA